MDKNEVKVEYCPTDLMLADFYTKSIVGRKFQEFREYLMGWRPIQELLDSINISKENVTSKEGVAI